MAEALPDLPMAETVMVRLLRISVVGMGQFFDPIFLRLGLTESSFHVLCLLMANENGHASPSDLADLVGTSRANMTRILEMLIRDDYVTRATQGRDGRRNIITITEKGRNAATDAVPAMVEPLKLAFSDLTPEEFDQLEFLLRKVTASFDKAAVPFSAVA